jgi:nudix-type nucleoside diphosphatase (YffH/AdpP family)
VVDRPLFFFGTLLHPPLLEAVLGDVSHVRLSPDRLPGYRVRVVAEGLYPGLEVDPAACAQGLRVSGLSAQNIARLDFYEECFDYVLRDLEAEDGTPVRVYFPAIDTLAFERPWSLADWARDWGDLSVLAAREVMRYFGIRSPQATGKMFPMIRARAASTLRAAGTQDAGTGFSGEIEILAHRHPYAHFYALEEFDLRHRRFDGTMSPVMERAVFRAVDAALVLPYDPERDLVLLIEQMRVGPLARGDATCWSFEPIAGLIDPGETPEQTARREAREEAGLDLGSLFQVAEAYPSPGNSSEFHYVFVGFADLKADVTGIAGVDSENEDIRSHLMPFDALLEACDRQAIANAPLVLAAYWLARHRDRLRAMA